MPAYLKAEATQEVTQQCYFSLPEGGDFPAETSIYPKRSFS